MCGIFGFLLKNAIPKEQSNSFLDEGLKNIAHRGPDGSGKWLSEDGRVGLGHVRLSIIGADLGSQPMISNNERFTLIFNGEIYNYIEIGSELRLSDNDRRSDTRVLV